MKTNDFDYYLPEELIAQTPAIPRDSSRLLVYDKNSKKIEHKRFYDILSYLKEGDVLVRNNTRVLPARMFGETEHGGKVEILLLKRLDLKRWEVLVKPGKKATPGKILTLSNELKLKVLETVEESGSLAVHFVKACALDRFAAFRGFGHLQARALREKFDRARIFQIFGAHDKGDHVASRAAAEAVEGLRIRKDGKRRRFLAVERADALIVRAGTLQIDVG